MRRPYTLVSLSVHEGVSVSIITWGSHYCIPVLMNVLPMCDCGAHAHSQHVAKGAQALRPGAHRPWLSSSATLRPAITEPSIADATDSIALR